METLSGSFWFLFAFDVCDEIDLAAVRTALGVRPAVAAGTVKFERPPVEEMLEVDGGGRGRVSYYDYGVVTVTWQAPFALTWPELVKQASRLAEQPERQALAEKTVRARVRLVEGAMRRLRETWVDEEYYVVHVEASAHEEPPAEQLIGERGAEIAQIVRGEACPLAGSERDEILKSRMSYFPADLVVAGWTAAFVRDTAEGAAGTLALLEYANTQLLEFRHYDQVLTGVLGKVYDSLERKRGWWARWGMAREARELHTILLEVRELTGRADTAIQFLSDMYSARVYGVAAGKIGVEDYRRLVDSKLKTAGELYAFLMEQFHAGRAFLLELMVVVILVIELGYLFAGKR